MPSVAAAPASGGPTRGTAVGGIGPIRGGRRLRGRPAGGGGWRVDGADAGTRGVARVTGRVGVLTMVDSPQAVYRLSLYDAFRSGNLWVNWWDGGQWHWADQGKPAGARITGTVGVLTMMDRTNAPLRPNAFCSGCAGIRWSNERHGGRWHRADQGRPAAARTAGWGGRVEG